MKFSRSFLSSASGLQVGKTCLRTLINYSLVFIAGMVVNGHMLLGDVSGFWDVVDDKPVSVRYAGIIKKTEGRDGNSTTWKLVDWENPISEDEEDKFNCYMKPFIPTRSNNTASPTQLCVHSFNDIISSAIKKNKRWYNCDGLPELWDSKDINRTDNDINLYYVEVGANVGSCVMEMLLSTNASIIAFEPHPMNVYNLKKSVSQLGKSYQDRLMLFPIGLAESANQSTIFSANDNMGNSVVGRAIKDDDRPAQDFTEELQFPIHIERLDSILNAETNINIRLMKIDAQGYECKVLQGMGQGLAKKIDLIKIGYQPRFMRPLGCLDLVEPLNLYGYQVFRNHWSGHFSFPVSPATVGAMKRKHTQLYALRKRLKQNLTTAREKQW